MVFAERVERLHEALGRLPSLVVALSGGVDSAALLGAAARALPGRVFAATARGPSVPGEEVADAARVAAALGVPHAVVETREMDDERYRANRGDRCYFCRVEMVGRLRAFAASRGVLHVADGLQADDLAADRPGVRASDERGVLHPLRDAGLGKADVRRLARALGLHVHEKPAQPCLASRLPVGVPVTEERLARVHRAELALRARGYSVVRVRCEDTHGRIEIGAEEHARAEAEAGVLVDAVRAAGFATAALDENPYRWKSGR